MWLRSTDRWLKNTLSIKRPAFGCRYVSSFQYSFERGKMNNLAEEFEQMFDAMRIFLDKMIEKACKPLRARIAELENQTLIHRVASCVPDH